MSFDSWGGNSLADSDDVEGIIVRVDNQTILKHPLPTRNGRCGDVTSLQTGNRVGRTSGKDPTVLCWQTLDLELDLDGFLRVTWKGLDILSDYQTRFVPSRGQFVLAGRTGIVSEFVHVDNVRIQTDPTDITPQTGPSRSLRLANTGADWQTPILDATGVPLNDSFRAQLQYSDGVNIGPATWFAGDGFFAGDSIAVHDRNSDGVASLRIAILNRSGREVGISAPFVINIVPGLDQVAPPLELVDLKPFRISTENPRSRLADGLVAHFPFDGSAEESIGNVLQSLVSGANLTTDRFGTADAAYEFDGIDDVITVTDSTGVLDFGRSDFTLSLWFQTSHESPLQYLVAKRSQGTDAGYGLGLNQNQQALVYIADTADAPPHLRIEGAKPVDDGRWHHMVASFVRDAKVSIYLDQRLVVFEPIAPEFPLPSDKVPMTIGALPGALAHYSGKIDDLRFYDRALNRDEVRDLSRWPPFRVSLGDESRVVLRGDTIRWEVSIDPEPGDSQEVTYRWELNGERIAETNEPFLSLANVSDGDLGYYSVSVELDGEEVRSVARELLIGKQAQEIVWPDLTQVIAGEAEIPLGVIATSGLPVALEITSGPGQLIGDRLVVQNAGRVTLLATQPGDERYLPASDSVRQIEVLVRPHISAGTGGIVEIVPSNPTFRLGEELTLTAIPNENFGFIGWNDSHEGAPNPLTITVDEIPRVEARFELRWPLTLEQSPGGRIFSNPDQSQFPDNTKIDVLAIPDEGFRFDGWTGDVEGTRETAVFFIKAPTRISAIFVEALPRLSDLPEELWFSPNEDVRIEIQASGGGNEFQWFKDDTLIEGARDSVLLIPSVGNEDVGQYRVSVTNASNGVVSASTYLRLRPRLQFLLSELGLTIDVLGGEGGEEWQVEVSSDLRTWTPFDHVTLEATSEGPKASLAEIPVSEIGLFFRVVP